MTEQFLNLRKKIIKNDLSRLNDRQFEAAVHTEGPLLVLAGAGSGKTTVLINRVYNLLKYGSAYNSSDCFGRVNQDVLEKAGEMLRGNAGLYADLAACLRVGAPRPWEILVITFTNKAANELKSRLERMLGPMGEEVWASTFHSCCVRILRRECERIGYPSRFTIYDMDDSARLMKDCQKKLGIEEKYLSHKTILSAMSRAKDALLTPDEYIKEAMVDVRLQKIGQAYKMYQEALKTAGAMDFDDLIFNTIKLFRENSDVLDKYSGRFKYIMVDEYQDTNFAQYILVSLLAKKHGNICVVGDDDQSIYRFRGATIENILNFEDHFKNTKTVKLEQNYRSTSNILNAANEVIKNNEGRKGKTLWTSNGGGEKITVKAAMDETMEARFVADEIIKTASGKAFGDFAVLYRMNAMSAGLERAFVKAGIPYRIIGGHRFFDRKEIRDAVAYLAVVANHNDNVRLTRIINEPKRGIGDATVGAAADIAAGLGLSIFDVIKSAEEYPRLMKSAARLKSFANMITEFSKLAEERPMNEVFLKLMEETGYLEYLKQDEAAGRERLENINELTNNLKRFADENPESTITDFLEEVALLTDIDNYNADTDAVVLMTLHAAKGLEFPVCFIVGMEEGIFPSQRSAFEPDDVEEERRLAYVGITRAKEKLYLINAKSRLMFGSTVRNFPSRFLREVPGEYITEIEDDNKLSGFYGIAPNAPEDENEIIYAGGDTFKVPMKKYAGGFGVSDKIKKEVPKKEALPSFKAGDAVEHKKFGPGVILSAENMGNDVLLEVAFEKTGTKKLMAKAAGNVMSKK
ncbi:MAG: UvrD-helicase domain-containing protein [Oscillospiraceae bacterium]|nr:UvrD-helicase domain-containing protein [Oscillospiraceae bacterium]